MIAVEAPVGMPSAPQRLEDTGLSADVILELVTKTLHVAGELKGTELARRLGVPFQVIEPSLDLLKRDRFCEIVGGQAPGPPSYSYRLTDAGRVRALLFLESSRYVGTLPVTLQQYTAYMNSFVREYRVNATRSSVRDAFAHLVLSPRMLDQLGPAIAAWHSLFVHGPTGNGKSAIAQAIRNVLRDDIAVPHAILIDRHIVRVYDPVTHEPRPLELDAAASLRRTNVMDGRWVRCRRPLVTAGGEMTLASLDLGDGDGGFYRAPLQLLANGGVLVIDDFGRQQVPPSLLLNRWIVPLENGVDYLTLQTGEKFEVPFHVFVVFTTNLRPRELPDEAFLRRIRYKVLAESPDIDAFVEIFANYCRAQRVSCEPFLAESMIARELGPRQVALRGCHPRDLIEHALAIARYFDRTPHLTSDLMREACASYFVEDRDPAAA
jgi:predicted ATPase with chaperone activity